MNFFWFLILLPLLLLLILAVAVAAARWERKWRTQQQRQDVGILHLNGALATWQNKLQMWQARLADLDQIKTLSKAVGAHRQPADLTKQFLAWADTALTDQQALQAWLQRLPEQGQRILTQRLAAFCSDIGFELVWLVDHHLDIDPAVAQSAKEVVVHYCRACYLAVTIFGDLQLLKPYLVMKETPGDKMHRALGQQLYTDLVAAKLAAPLPAEIALAPESTRWEYVIGAIDQAVTNHPAEVCEMIKQAARTAAASTVPEVQTAATPWAQQEQPV